MGLFSCGLMIPRVPPLRTARARRKHPIMNAPTLDGATRMTMPDAAYRRATSKALDLALASAKEADVYIIGRAQEKRETSLLVINGRTEHMGVTRLKGL